MVRLEVGMGREAVVFNLHKRLLCDKIPVFDKMFNGHFEESTTQTAKMPEDNVEAFKIMIGWVYNGVIEPDIGLEFKTPNSSKTPLIELLILAEKYDVTALVDATMDYLMNFLREKRLIIGQSLWPYVYKHTRRTSRLRLFLTRMAIYAMRFKDGEFTDNRHFWNLKDIHSIMSQNPDILMDYLAWTKAAKPQEYPVDAPQCDYHRHGANETCPYTSEGLFNVTNANGKRPNDQAG